MAKFYFKVFKIFQIFNRYNIIINFFFLKNDHKIIFSNYLKGLTSIVIVACF